MLKVKKVYQMQDGVLKEFEEVRHGEWEYDPDGTDWGLGAWKCSVCHGKNDALPINKDLNPYWFACGRYCPQCGAKMRKKKDKEESVYDKLPPEVKKHVDEAVARLLGKDE